MVHLLDTRRLRPRLRNPAPESRFFRHHGHLAQFRTAAQVASYWTDYWRSEGKLKLLWAPAERGVLDPYEDLFSRWVQRDGLTLEAGCGPAQYVLALHRRGYRVQGVDLDQRVVDVVRAQYPELEVRVGDVTRLPLADGALATYISLGVIEHFEYGPQQVMHEARRVLRPGGIALFSIPFLNQGRQAHLHGLAEGGGAAPLEFYQYYYSAADFRRFAAEVELEIIEERALFPEHHLVVDHWLFSRYWNSRLNLHRFRARERAWLKRFTDAPEWIRRRYAHMMMFVCRRR